MVMKGFVNVRLSDLVNAQLNVPNVYLIAQLNVLVKVNLNVYLIVQLNVLVNIHLNVYLSVHLNVYLIAQFNIYLITQLNVQVNVQLNVHLNGHHDAKARLRRCKGTFKYATIRCPIFYHFGVPYK